MPDRSDVADAAGAPRGGVWTIVVAGGSGARLGGPKQYEPLGDRRVLDHAVAVARAASEGVVVVVPAADAERESGVPGGPTRAASVANGLRAVPEEATIVCVHDAARPFATAELFAAVIAAVRAGADGAVPGVAVTDTIKQVDPAGNVVATLARETLVAVQTPQAFRAAALRAAHAASLGATDPSAAATDDASMVEAGGGRVVVVPGEADNRKITYPADLTWARARLER